MKPPNYSSLVPEQKGGRSCLCSLFPAASLIFLIFFIGSAFIATDHKEKLSLWGISNGSWGISNGSWGFSNGFQRIHRCKNECRPLGSEALPEGIVSKTSNLQMRPLWGFPENNASTSIGLLAIPVGIKQKDLVHKMVSKFLASEFVVMLFHYDGNVDGWNNYKWYNHVIHVSAVNQTKWWFAKRFLHPDIVSEYSYIFLWDEDLGVDDLDPGKYLSIVKSERLEISQPALDVGKSEVHHLITARWRKSKVHRRAYKPGGNGTGCDRYSTTPPCTGWIELMAPVFSRAAWRCVWHMIQNDLIHAWGLDKQLGYCAQGDRTKKVGVVDAEYIVHYGRPTLGGAEESKENSTGNGHTAGSENKASSHHSHVIDPRVEVRRQSYVELDVFNKRWEKAVEEDKCWIDPYQ